MSSSFIQAVWPAPKNVRAVCSTKNSPSDHKAVKSLYPDFNLANHVNDHPTAVMDNRAILRDALSLSSEPCWLQQVHGIKVLEAEEKARGQEADASFSTSTKNICVIQTADCLPVLFCDQQGSCVAAAHAGWRGLQAGVLEATVESMSVVPENILAWLGPAISQQAYEVGEEVYTAFVDQNTATKSAFRFSRAGHWMLDLYTIATLRLHACGVHSIYGGGYCTYSDKERFYSYRRDGATGRMASLIWINS